MPHKSYQVKSLIKKWCKPVTNVHYLSVKFLFFGGRTIPSPQIHPKIHKPHVIHNGHLTPYNTHQPTSSQNMTYITPSILTLYMHRPRRSSSSPSSNPLCIDAHIASAGNEIYCILHYLSPSPVSVLKSPFSISDINIINMASPILHLWYWYHQHGISKHARYCRPTCILQCGRVIMADIGWQCTPVVFGDKGQEGDWRCWINWKIPEPDVGNMDYVVWQCDQDAMDNCTGNANNNHSAMQQTSTSWQQ